MRELFLKIFGAHEASSNNGIALFSWAHILYLVLIIASVVVLSVVYFKKDKAKKDKLLDIIAILIMASYILDFFLQPFWHNGTLEENGSIILDKFPFHICTALCPLIFYSRFAKHGKAIKTPAAILSSLAPLMWLIYPGTALDTDLAFYSYEIVQLFFYHGLVFIYGIVALILQDEELDIKKCYKEAICVVGIALWATLGNVLYSEAGSSGYNWFFLKDPVFSFIPKTINPYVVVVIMYLSCLFVYGVNYFVKYIISKNNYKSVKR